MANITVITVYEGMTEIEVRQFANRVFKKNMMGGDPEFDNEQVMTMKSEFLAGNHVGAQAGDPAKGMIKTRWKLNRVTLE